MTPTEQQNLYPSNNPYSIPSPIIGPVGGVPGTLIAAAVVWGIAGVISVSGPIVDIIQSRLMSQSIAQNYYDNYDPLVGQMYGSFDSITTGIQTPWMVATIFFGFVGLLGYAAVSIFVLRGSIAARIIATVLSALSIFMPLAIFILGIFPLFQFLFTLAGAILVWMPPSNRYFAAKRVMKLNSVHHSGNQHEYYFSGPVA